mmetsp:Transcript_18055/g.20395  ORF Transcript_18055/g.20395 Transcript_18055/m.20395 type:complete len:110 (+) Transcript_18055:85-414(+)
MYCYYLFFFYAKRFWQLQVYSFATWSSGIGNPMFDTGVDFSSDVKQEQVHRYCMDIRCVPGDGVCSSTVLPAAKGEQTCGVMGIAFCVFARPLSFVFVRVLVFIFSRAR